MKKLLVIIIVSTMIFGCEKQASNQLAPKQSNTARGKKPTPPPINTIPAPTGLTVTQTSNGVLIKWNAVINATTYWVYRNGSVLSIIPPTQFTDVYVNVGSTYSYSVAAVVNSTLGAKSNSVTITIAP